jgi:hypothetical protein
VRPCGRRARLPFRHDDQDQQGGSRTEGGEKSEEVAPAQALHDDLGRTGGGQGAEGTQHDEPAVGERQAMRWKPQHDGLEPAIRARATPSPISARPSISMTTPSASANNHDHDG